MHARAKTGCRPQRSARPFEDGGIDPRASPVFFDVVAKLLDGVGVGVERELLRTLNRKKAGVNDPIQGSAGGGVSKPAVVDFDRAGPLRADFNRRRRLRWMEIDEDAVSLQPPMRTSQGIDHALCRDSSQRPRKQHDIDALRCEQQRVDGDRARIDHRQAAHHIGDRVGVGIDSCYRLGARGVPAGQSAIAAADFKDATRRERHGGFERRNFVAFGIFIDSTWSLPLLGLAPG